MSQADIKTSPIRLLMIDDSRGLCSWVEPTLNGRGFEVVGVAYDRADAVEQIGTKDFDIALVDIELSLYDTEGLSLVPLIKARHPEARVAIFSAYVGPESDLVRRVRSYEVDAILNKHLEVDQVCEALRMVVEHPSALFIDPKLRSAGAGGAVQHLTAIEMDFIRDYARRPMERRVWAREHGKPARFFDNRMDSIGGKILRYEYWPNGDERRELSRLEVYEWARMRFLHFE
jgi:DNA-binding NarL/FixJ family response regulator